ncbi:MAG: hypothetical protein AAFX94_03985 [Myxococcota bacterium]
MAKTGNERLAGADDTYGSVSEALAVIEFFTRWARAQSNETRNDTVPELWPRQCEVQFVEPTSAPHVFRTHQPAGSPVLYVLVADPGFEDEERERLRLFYAERFTPTLRDCQLRACANLWRQIAEEERAGILRGLEESGVSPITVNAVLSEMRASTRTPE